MDVTAGAGAVRGELRHEGQAHARRLGELLEALLEDDVAVRHLEGAGVAHVQLVLALPPFALRGLDRHARKLEVAARRCVEALGARALQDVIVLQVPACRLEIAIALPGGVAVARAEEVVLELGGGEAAVSQGACGVDLLTKNGARRDVDEIVGLLAFHVAQHERGLV